MIRIYTDEPGWIELVVRENGLVVSPAPVRFTGPEVPHPRARRRRLGLATAALLVAVSAGGGYFLAPRSSPAHPTAAADAPPKLPGAALQAFRTVGQAAPAPGPQALANALATKPSVITPPPGTKPERPEGVAAFGLQP